MLASAYALQRNEHIRIDILSNLLSRRARDWTRCAQSVGGRGARA